MNERLEISIPLSFLIVVAAAIVLHPGESSDPTPATRPAPTGPETGIENGAGPGVEPAEGVPQPVVVP